MKYVIKDSQENALNIQFENDSIFLNGQVVDVDLKKLPSNQYHIIDENLSYNIEVLEFDFVSKVFKIKVNGNVIDLNLENELDVQLRDMGMSVSGSDEIDEIIAPMPGLVLKILVEEGQEVQKGDSMVILEAMKMENVIKSAGSGIVKKVLVNVQDAVEKNQVIIEME